MRNYWLVFIIMSICTIKSMGGPDRPRGKQFDIKQQVAAAFFVTQSQFEDMKKRKKQLEDKVKLLAQCIDDDKRERDEMIDKIKKESQSLIDKANKERDAMIDDAKKKHSAVIYEVKKERDGLIIKAKRDQKISFLTGIVIGCVATSLIWWKLKTE